LASSHSSIAFLFLKTDRERRTTAEDDDDEMADAPQWGMLHTTLSTTTFSSPAPTTTTLDAFAGTNIDTQATLLSSSSSSSESAAVALPEPGLGGRQMDSTVNGVVIGLLSSFGSAILIALIFLLVYFFRYTSRGRILLDRLGRPGEYDDEQAYAREEAEALEVMDDLQRTEYFRAKGTSMVYSLCTSL
jgi:hypothetical protein